MKGSVTIRFTHNKTVSNDLQVCAYLIAVIYFSHSTYQREECRH